MEIITNKKKRGKTSDRSETWINITINPEEIEQSPTDTLAQLTEENNHLLATVEDQAAELYNAMRERLAHKGKDFTDVGKKQQHRQSTQIKYVPMDVVYHKKDFLIAQKATLNVLGTYLSIDACDY